VNGKWLSRRITRGESQHFGLSVLHNVDAMIGDVQQEVEAALTKRIWRAGTSRVVIFVVVVLLQGCAGVQPGFETPTVTVTSFRTLPGQGMLPEFEIGLKVINPNREALELAGVAYSVRLEGQDIIKGVQNQLPVIEGYGEGDVTLTAAPNLLGGIRLVTDLMSRPRERVAYILEAKLDPGGLSVPIRVREEGQITLR